jgi:hypothetical protein
MASHVLCLPSSVLSMSALPFVVLAWALTFATGGASTFSIGFDSNEVAFVVDKRFLSVRFVN